MGCSSAIIVSQCIKSIEKLLTQTHPERDADISNQLTIIKIELDKDLAIRVHAGKEGLYSALIRCLRKVKEKYLILVFQTLTSLSNQNPNLLDKSGLEFMIAFLNTNVDLEIIFENLKWIKNCITAHEKNRSQLIQMKIQDSFRNLLQEFSDKPRLVIQICQVTKKLVSDDDIRVVHGNPHDHAKALANEVLCTFISLLHRYNNDLYVLIELIPAITALIVRDEFCLKVYEQNGLCFVLEALTRFSENEKICRHCLMLFKALAGSDYVKGPIIQYGAAPIIVSVTYKHKSCPVVAAAGCICISALALRNPYNAQRFVEAGAPELLMTVMNIHRDNPVVLKNGCWAIRNIVARSFEYRPKFASLGVESLLKESKNKFPRELNYEVRVTLRDLGCDIEDEFPWPKKEK